MGDAERKRISRAKNTARKTLEEKGYVVYEVASDYAPHPTLIAFDPDELRLREVILCVGAVPALRVRPPRRPRGIGLEVWHRKPGEVGFSITRL